MQEFFKRVSLLCIVVAVSAFTTGCANRATGSVGASTNLFALKQMYVRVPAGNDDGTAAMIADKLRTKGIVVTTGTQPTPSNVDAVVTHISRWQWDMTMYLLELTVDIRDPKTEASLATGNSMHTSLTRRSQEEMVREVIDNIYKAAKEPTTPTSMLNAPAPTGNINKP